MTDWVAVVALAVAVLGLVPLYVDLVQRMRDKEPPVSVETFHESLKPPFDSEYSIRVWAHRRIEHCQVKYDGRGIITIVRDGDKNQGRYETLIVKNGGANFRLPAIFTISDDALVEVSDGKKKIFKAKWGSIPRTSV